MNGRSKWMWLAAWAALLPCLAPQWVMANPARQTLRAPKTVDLELKPGGVVRGQVLEPTGQPAKSGAIRAYRGDELLGVAKVDRNGRFQLQGLPPGACQLQLLTATQPMRLWAPGTAPPKSPQELLLVTGQPTERGQQEIGRILANPLFIGLAVAAAVAIPLAIHDDSGS